MNERTFIQPRPVLDVLDVSLLVLSLSNLLWAELPRLLSIILICISVVLGLMVLTDVLIAICPRRSSYWDSRIYMPESSRTSPASGPSKSWQHQFYAVGWLVFCFPFATAPLFVSLLAGVAAVWELSSAIVGYRTYRKSTGR